MTDFNVSLVELIDERISKRLLSFRDEMEGNLDKRVEAVVNPPETVTRKWAADRLNVSMPTLHKLMNDGEIRFIKIGRSTRFERQEIERFLKSRQSRRA